jgi:hypothetical protein
MRFAQSPLLSCAIAFLAACDQGAPPQPSPLPVVHIGSIDVLIEQSNPAKVSVWIRGTLPDACSVIDAVHQERVVRNVTVTLVARREAGVCAQVIVPFDRTVRLDGSFPPGNYVVIVNRIERSFSVPGPQ